MSLGRPTRRKYKLAAPGQRLLPLVCPSIKVSRLHIRHLVRSDGFAGVERYLTYVAPELARRGHQVSVVGGAPGAMDQALAGSEVDFMPASTVVEVARAAARRPRPDLLHAHMTAADLAGVAVGAVLRRPVVSTLHFAGGRGHSAATRLPYRALRLGLAAEVAVSAYVADRAPGRAQVIPTGIPEPAAAADQTRQPVVLVAQRLEPEKATDVALAAWARSGLAAKGWRLVVAGDGSQAADLHRLADTLGGGDSIEFVGHDPDLTDRMRRCSILLAPTADEAFGLTVVEAMAVGLPVVAAAGGGHVETLGPVSPATLFPPGDVAGAAERLRALALDPAARHQLAPRLRARFEDTYRVERHVDALEALYRRLVASGTGRTDGTDA